MQLRVLALLAVVMNSIGSCGGGDKLDVTLRSRDGFVFADTPTGCTFWHDKAKCVATALKRQWVDADGRRATSPAASESVDFSSMSTGPAVCNGNPLTVDERWFKWNAAGRDIDVQFEDGDAMTLYDEQGMAVIHLDYISCSEASGTWRGTGGSLVGRSGTYTSVYDSIQTVLHLVEE